MSDPTEFMRLASPNERRTISREDVGYYNALIIAAVYEIASENVDVNSAQSFLAPLRHCIGKYPYLNVVVRDKHTEKPAYEAVSSIDLHDHVSIIHEDEASRNGETEKFEEILPAILDRPWPADIPPWRIVVLPLVSPRDSTVKRCFIAFAFSHALGDGMVGVAFHRTFLDAWRQTAGVEEKASFLVAPPSQTLPPPFDTPERLPISWKFLLEPLIAVYLPKFVAKMLGLRASASTLDAGTWIGSPMFFDPAATLKSRVRIIEIEAPLVQKALQTSRSHGTKLTATMHQMIVRALSSAIPSPDVTNFVSGTPVDMRASIGTPSLTWGLFVSGHYEVHPRVPIATEPALSEEMWAAASSMSQNLAECGARLQDQAIGLLRYVPSIRNWTLSKIGQQRDSSYELSNLLAFDNMGDGADQKCKVVKMVFSQPGNVTSAPLVFNIISVKEGSLTCTTEKLTNLPFYPTLSTPSSLHEDCNYEKPATFSASHTLGHTTCEEVRSTRNKSNESFMRDFYFHHWSLGCKWESREEEGIPIFYIMAGGKSYDPVLVQPDPPGPPQNHVASRDETNSLEDLLRNDPFTYGPAPKGNVVASVTPRTLVDNLHSERSFNIDPEDDGSQSSQEMTSQPSDPTDPSNLPLPVSRPPSTRRPRRGDRMVDPTQLGHHSIDETSPPSYRKILENAGKVLEHIKNGSVGKTSRHIRTAITYYDYFDNSISRPRRIDIPMRIESLRHVPQDVQQRLILVEDLSEPMIEELGENFSINPEFFEEHLLNSGYAGGKYDSPPARNWSTASFEKSYMSFKWIRPVYQLPTFFSSGDLEDLLEDQITHFTRDQSVTTKIFTNIFRPAWGLWTDPTKTVRMKRMCGLEERVSIWRKKLIGQDTEIVIVILDPLPAISEIHRYRASNGSQGWDDSDYALYHSSMVEEIPQRVRKQRTLARSLNWIIGGKRRTNNKLEKKLEVLNTVIIEQIAPRQTVSVDLDCVFQTPQSMADLEEQLSETKSTKSEVCESLGTQLAPSSLVKPLLRIIKQDTVTLLNQLRQVLDEINIEILDDTKMEDRLGLWRQIINRAQRELPELRSSMEPFIEFLLKLHPLNSPVEIAAVRVEVTQDIYELWKDIDHIIDRLQRTSASLTSNMGLLDSRRSIDEAHSVARLTELAFIFVPMSFAASVFGMEIEPFANPVPISNFFAVAIAVTLFAYLMRVTMQSHWLIDLKEIVKHDVRRYAARNGQTVQPRSLPMVLILRSIATRLGTRIASICKWGAKKTCLIAKKIWAVFGFIISFVLLNGVASGIPIALLWTRDLDSGIRDAVSIAIAFIVIVTVGVPFWFRSTPKFRNALPDLIMNRVGRTPFWVRMTLIYLIFTAIFIAVPLALIWTRPLATDIKTGLTMGVVMIMIVLMVIVNLLGPLGRRYFDFISTYRSL
ncbi:Mg2+ transporter protein, CorA-like/Zinc transport protein ZntB [Penicillium expansum]|uniref:Mg2+ transporter protein, CorA-like/Zinc transport protein ZntB n=1 Tax=Penicillium expansum TaxID=27334 RepID=A0A0A2JA27_PENEN|nr:Mg2+ transporter protein, CorA-like/Zinc transport protein ZntB [Penicillium expansum]KGO49175.1 Mg2+ transporter protein, CorA-like/Zinc transport protein ZntB [Penicillium expansum]KGO53929.1 Mg2+ transporter protein, CorA-like/Zinc transport protein ZntB [Penicillium expansum]